MARYLVTGDRGRTLTFTGFVIDCLQGSGIIARDMAKHPDKHIRAAIKYALSKGWRLTKSQGHIWGQLWCPEQSRDGCIIRVFSTPRNAENHAKFIRRRVDGCPHS